jgi:hypothetical protein
MASQNIPSQSCTHLLRILLVMAEADIACDGGGVGDQGGWDLMLFPRTSRHPWLLDYYRNMQSLGAIRPSKRFLCFLCRPASSIQAPPPLLLWSSFVCTCEHKGGFSGPNWCPKLGLLGQIGFQTAFIGSIWCVNWVCWAKLGSSLGVSLLLHITNDSQLINWWKKMKAIFLEEI